MAKSVEDLLGELAEGIEQEQKQMRRDLGKQLAKASRMSAERIADELAGNAIDPQWLRSLTPAEVEVFRAGMRLAADLAGDPHYDI